MLKRTFGSHAAITCTLHTAQYNIIYVFININITIIQYIKDTVPINTVHCDFICRILCSGSYDILFEFLTDVSFLTCEITSIFPYIIKTAQTSAALYCFFPLWSASGFRLRWVSHRDRRPVTCARTFHIDVFRSLSLSKPKIIFFFNSM